MQYWEQSRTGVQQPARIACSDGAGTIVSRHQIRDNEGFGPLEGEEEKSLDTGSTMTPGSIIYLFLKSVQRAKWVLIYSFPGA